MSLTSDPPAITADDDALARAIDGAELPSLLPALAYLTGDMSLVADELRPPGVLSAVVLPQAGMSDGVQALARQRAWSALRRFRDGGCVPSDPPAPADLRTMMEFITGPLSDDYLPLLTFELGLPEEIGSPGWRKDEMAPERSFSVAVIGAGMSGLAMAHRLSQADVAFVVLERNADVGGVWLENTYPGCRLDTSNFNYSYSFAQKPDWPQQFSLQQTILEYFRAVTDALSLRRHIRFGSEVHGLVFDDETARWNVSYRSADGTEETLQVEAVVSAVGQLNQPRYPDIPGRDRFRGPSWHTARWRHDIDITGRRVAVVGTGASAFQVIPAVAERVGELRVFQRNAPYVMPTPTYHADIPAGRRWLFDVVPHYHRWFRFYQFWTSVEGRRPFSEVDPKWHHEISVSEVNERLRQTLVDGMRQQFADRPDLADKLVPRYPPYAKRMLRDDGAWAATLHQGHVHLVTEAIEAITEDGIRTTDGAEHQVDVIVYGTGFCASDFLGSIDVRGRGGGDLHAHWGDEPRAYLGITVPGFPNLFCLYGPNTNLVVNGSLFLFSECEVHYVMECLRLLLDSGARAMDLRPEVLDAFSERVDRANALMAWGVPGVTNWYKNAEGRVTQNWPLSTLEFWDRTRGPEQGHYDLLR
jgi:4-hydroxyacetophenone monooxygenase